jgi:hypothetical protein
MNETLLGTGDSDAQSVVYRPAMNVFVADEQWEDWQASGVR